MRAQVTIRLPLASEKHRTSLVNALKPEVNSQIGVRSKVELKTEGLFLEVLIDAEDIVSLRAGLNAYLRWINSTISVIETLEKHSVNC